MALFPNLSETELVKFRTKHCDRFVKIGSCQFADRCQYSHNLEWTRRPLWKYQYSPIICEKVIISFTEDGKQHIEHRCPKKRACELSHTREEQMYHPSVYKVVLCKNYGYGKSCTRYFCPLAHSECEMRNPEDSIMNMCEQEEGSHHKKQLWQLIYDLAVNQSTLLPEPFDINDKPLPHLRMKYLPNSNLDIQSLPTRSLSTKNLKIDAIISHKNETKYEKYNEHDTEDVNIFNINKAQIDIIPIDKDNHVIAILTNNKPLYYSVPQIQYIPGFIINNKITTKILIIQINIDKQFEGGRIVKTLKKYEHINTKEIYKIHIKSKNSDILSAYIILNELLNPLPIPPPSILTNLYDIMKQLQLYHDVYDDAHTVVTPNLGLSIIINSKYIILPGIVHKENYYLITIIDILKMIPSVYKLYKKYPNDPLILNLLLILRNTSDCCINKLINNNDYIKYTSPELKGMLISLQSISYIIQDNNDSTIWLNQINKHIIEGSIYTLSNQQLKKSDIYSLGLSIWYLLTNCMTINNNFDKLYIEDDKYTIASSELLFDLLLYMTHPDPNIRPDCQQILNHPYFWDFKDCLDFIRSLMEITKEANVSLYFKSPEMTNKKEEELLNFNVLKMLDEISSKVINFTDDINIDNKNDNLFNVLDNYYINNTNTEEHKQNSILNLFKKNPDIPLIHRKLYQLCGDFKPIQNINNTDNYDYDSIFNEWEQLTGITFNSNIYTGIEEIPFEEEASTNFV